MQLDTYKSIMSSDTHATAQARRKNSDSIMEITWNNDIGAKRAYIYDYFHDSEKNKFRNLDPESDPLKTAVDIKYIVTEYGNVSKDQVEYHIMFRPSHTCELDYFADYEDTYNMNYPVGLYIDIPDERGIWRKWLICMRDYEQQFVKYSVLPCDECFHWVTDNKCYSMCGVKRSQSSYNSGITSGTVFTVPDDKKAIWLPVNADSVGLYYDQRIIISTPGMKNPLTWSVSKIDNVNPCGINKLVLVQDKFNPITDTLVNGVWYADYNKSAAAVEEERDNTAEEIAGYTAVLTPASGNIKYGAGKKRFTAVFTNTDGEEYTPDNIEWSVLVNGEENSSAVEYTENGQSLSATILTDEYLGGVLTVTVTDTDTGATDKSELEILSL